MKTRKDGIQTKIVPKDDFRCEYKTAWHKDRQVWESTITSKLYTARPHALGYELVPFPPVYKVDISIDPHSGEGSVVCSNSISKQTEALIGEFVYNLFTQYDIKEPKAYQVHVRLDVDWNLRKISVINCLGYVEDLHFTWLLSHYFKTLCSGSNVDAFIERYLPQGFSDGQMD